AHPCEPCAICPKASARTGNRGRSQHHPPKTEQQRCNGSVSEETNVNRVAVADRLVVIGCRCWSRNAIEDGEQVRVHAAPPFAHFSVHSPSGQRRALARAAPA